MANEIDALLNVKDASGVLNEIYPITKKENVQGLAELVNSAVSGKADKTALDSYSPKSHTHDDRYYTESEINTKLGSYLPKSGGTMTGALTLNGVPTADLQAATKKYVDDSATNIKPKAHKTTLTVAGWDSTAKTQTVNVADVLADETKQLILPMPTSASMSAYTEAGIMCTAQAAGKLTFTADTVPTADIPVYVTITPVAFS